MMNAFNPKLSGGINPSPIGSPGGIVLNEVRKTKSKMDILGVAETWWTQAGVRHVSGGVMYYSGNYDRNHRKGVGIVLTENLSRSVMKCSLFLRQNHIT